MISSCEGFSKWSYLELVSFSSVHTLRQKCEDSFDKLRTLEDIKQKLEIDLQDKTEALRIDIDQLELTERSTGISHKPDPLKVIYT